MEQGYILCRRCGGSGRHSWNPKDRDICYGCKGTGVVKASKTKGWHESPDASGKAPDHRDAKLRAQAKLAQNKPMKKTDPLDELYHSTFKSKSSKLQKEGIQSKRTHTYRGIFGRKLKDLGTIYAFTNFDDAVRWASKMQFDFKKPTIIVAFKANISEWEQDTHWESAGAKGKWLKKKGAVSPENIIEIVPLTLEMTRAVVQTGFRDKELTRLHGVVEAK